MCSRTWIDRMCQPGKAESRVMGLHLPGWCTDRMGLQWYWMNDRARCRALWCFNLVVSHTWMCLGILYGWVRKRIAPRPKLSHKMSISNPLSCAPQTDWRKCCLSPTNKKEELKSHPTHYACSPENDGYFMIATNVPLFQAFNQLPIRLDMSQLDNGGGIEETLRRNNAKYHRSCSLIFSNSKLERARKRAADIQNEPCEGHSKCSQSHECDLLEFFKHENQSFPAALSDSGKLHSSQKSQLVNILETVISPPDTEPKCDAIIIDVSSLVYSLSPKASKTFEEYAVQDVVPKTQAYSSKYDRTDIVFDIYLNSSLKAETQSKRGRGGRCREGVDAEWLTKPKY